MSVTSRTAIALTAAVLGTVGLMASATAATHGEHVPHVRGDVVSAHCRLVPNGHCKGAVLRGAKLRGAHLAQIDLRGADLTGADLRGADLKGANLSNASLPGANLSGANLTDANLTDANLTDANLSNAKLTGANFSGANVATVDLTDAIVSGQVGMTAPAAPTGLVVCGACVPAGVHGTLQTQWNASAVASSSPPVTQYVVTCVQQANASMGGTESAGLATNYTFPAQEFEQDTTYECFVYAVNAIGSSAQSDPESATTG